jgi:NAD(P)-dependent dehydrogenase (short-subunit alcohol dehydrogenase family)
MYLLSGRVIVSAIARLGRSAHRDLGRPPCRFYSRRMELFDLSGRVAVVTGGNRGIGLGYATGLVKAGASVAVWARDEATNAAAVAMLSKHGDAAAFVCDVAEPEVVDAAMARTIERFGRIDSFFANAGTTGAANFEDLALSDWQRVLDVTLTGVFVSVQAAARQMIEQADGGSIVATASVASTVGIPQSAHYSAAKGGVMQLVRAAAIRLARFDIRVNAIAPGWIETEMTVDVQAHDKANAAILARTPMRRWGTPTDFEGAAVFLASDASSYMTGAQIHIDGGLLAS